MTAGEKPRISLVGVTGYASIYVDLVRKAQQEGRLDVSALMVREQRSDHETVKEFQQTGTKVYHSFDAMCEGEAGKIDLCLIPTGIQLHASMTNKALRSGAHVLVEKPLTGSVKDALSIIHTEKETRRWVAVGFQDIYSRDIAWFKQQLLEGAIGKIKAVKVIGFWPRAISYYHRNNWAGKLMVDGWAAMDSPLNNAFAHFVNIALFVAGPQPNKSCNVMVTSADLYRAHDIESFDTGIVQGMSDSGIEFWFGVSHACTERREPEIHIIGEEGTAQWNHEQDMIIRPKDGKVLTQPVPDYAATRSAMFDAVIEKLLKPDTFICDTQMAICQTQIIDAIHKFAPIRTVANAGIDFVQGADEEFITPAIKGVERLFERAFDENVSLSEIGSIPTLPAKP